MKLDAARQIFKPLPSPAPPRGWALQWFFQYNGAIWRVFVSSCHGPTWTGQASLHRPPTLAELFSKGLDMSQQLPGLAELQATTIGLLPETLGLRFTAAAPDKIVAELPVTRALCTQPGTLHGGAIMAFADTLGAYGTALNLPEGAGTTTIESKTNFFARGIEGEKVIGECTPLHLRRRTMVWQTRVTRADGTLVAQITQTQIVLPPAKRPR